MPSLYISQHGRIWSKIKDREAGLLGKIRHIPSVVLDFSSLYVVKDVYNKFKMLIIEVL
jgi:hypothetical protein